MTESTETLSSALDFFSGSASKEDAPEPQETDEGSETETEGQATGDIEESATPADEKTQEQPASTKEPAKEATEEKEPWTKAAYLDEKAKRQALEERIRLLEQEREKPATTEAQANEAAAEETEYDDAPDYIDDPKAYAKWIKDKAVAEARSQIARERAALSAMAMRETTPDYDEVIKVFVEMNKENPNLYPQAEQQPNPAKYAYDMAKRHIEAKRLSDPAEMAKMEERIRKEEREKVLAELSSQQAAKPKIPNTPDLLNAASARSGTGTKPRLKSGKEFFDR